MNLLTKRMPTIVGILLLLALVGAGVWFWRSQVTPVDSEIVPAKVRITNISDNKFSVSWVTTASTLGAIEYGPVGEKLTTKVLDERDSGQSGNYQTHHVTIEGLQPNAQYAFRILSGEKLRRFDNSGSPYTATTGPVIGATPPSVNFYGKVETQAKQVASGSIVYLTLPGSATVSSLVNESGNYAITISTIRKSDMRGYVDYDPAASVASLTIEGGSSQSIASVSLANSAPVPTITLGQNADYLNPMANPTVAEIQTESSPEEPITPSILNVEPLENNEINAVSTTSVVLLNPKEEGEILKTLRPEFRGTGPAGMVLSIALTGQKAVSDSTEIESDGTWSWAPVIDLKVGKQTITISYIATGGSTQQLKRNFEVSTSTTGLDPAFVSSPSASTTSTSSATTPTPAPREVMPSTQSGVPVTGVITNTLLTLALGIVIMVLGAALLVL